MNPSKACCNVPPVEVNYTAKGNYAEVQGMKTYHTGLTSAPTGILLVGDIFGFGAQVLQGADILAYGGEKKYQVFVPDFLRGQYADHSWFPPNTPEKGAALGAYFQGPASPATALGAIPGILKELEAKSNGTITKWGAVGLCWGGKIVTLNCGAGTPFAAAASAHPAMVDPADAANVTIPFALLASKDEDPVAVQGFSDGLKVEKLIETFPDMDHGFMANRGNLNDAKTKGEYKRAYEMCLEFFYKHL